MKAAMRLIAAFAQGYLFMHMREHIPGQLCVFYGFRRLP